MKKWFDSAWKHSPALYFSLLFLVGIFSAFHLWGLLFLIFIPKKHLCLLAFFAFFFFKTLYPSFPDNSTGTALFHIEEVKPHTGPFTSGLVYIGQVKSFHSSNQTWHRLPCRFYTNKKKNRPLAHCDYLISEASLIETSPYHYILKSKGTWTPIKGSHTLAEWRFQLKENVRKKLKPLYKNSRVYHLMAALLTGNMNHRTLSYQFGVVGQQHLLAISGFHFALLTLFLAFVLKRFLSERALSIALIVLLTGYFFYMGSTPSIHRAWIGVLIFLFGKLFHLRPTALNALGVALLSALILDPLVITKMGFQLSFGATLGILLFYIPFEKRLEVILPKRPFKVLKEMPLCDQGGYLLCAYIRKVCALNGAVLTFTLPLLLFHFHHFPLLSLVYNLFFPLLFSLMMGGLIIGLFIPGVSIINEHYAHFLLDLIANAPKRLMFQLGIQEALTLSILGILSFVFMTRKKELKILFMLLFSRLRKP